MTEPRPHEMIVVVGTGNMMQKKEIKVKYFPSKLVSELKKVIAKELKVSAAAISLTYNNQIMSDLKTVRAYNIKPDSKVNCQVNVKATNIVMKK